MTITPEGARVLGSLVEKQLTTPQQYPLTANALSLACSQVTNRHPVVTMDEETVLRALTDLKQEQHLVRFVLPSHGRSVTRYRHVLDEVYGLDEPGLALLAVLLLRGPQTPGELRTRTERMTAFSTVAGVQEQLEVLAARDRPLVRLLPRRPGQKEDRWQQTLADQWEDTADPSGDDGWDRVGVGSSEPMAEYHRVSEVASDAGSTGAAGEREAELTALRRDLDMLRAEVADLRGSLTELAGSLDALRLSLGG